MQAVTLLGPRSMADIHEAALATLAPPPDRRDEFEAQFRRAISTATPRPSVEGEADEETRIKDDGGACDEENEVARQAEGGALSSGAEQLSARDFQRDGDGLAAFRRKLAAALPARRSFRTVRTHARGKLDLRRSLREIVSADGDIPSPLLRRRQTVPRKLLLADRRVRLDEALHSGLSQTGACGRARRGPR